MILSCQKPVFTWEVNRMSVKVAGVGLKNYPANMLPSYNSMLCYWDLIANVESYVT